MHMFIVSSSRYLNSSNDLQLALRSVTSAKHSDSTDPDARGFGGVRATGSTEDSRERQDSREREDSRERFGGLPLLVRLVMKEAINFPEAEPESLGVRETGEVLRDVDVRLCLDNLCVPAGMLAALP